MSPLVFLPRLIFTFLSLNHIFINMSQTIGTYLEIIGLIKMNHEEITIIVNHHFGSAFTLKSVTRYPCQRSIPREQNSFTALRKNARLFERYSLN